jgi:cell division protease FtsH
MDDLEEARDKVRWGRAKKSRKVDEHDQKIAAYHEAGHALVQAMIKGGDPLHKVSILPRGIFGGATFSLPERDRTVYTTDYLKAQIMIAFGGRIAEDMFFGEISSGAGMDIKQVTQVARSMIKEFGMSDKLGFIYYGDEDGQGGVDMFRREYSDNTADLIDREVKALIDSLYVRTRKLMEENRDKIQTIAEALLKYETLTGDEVHALIRGDTLDKPTISDLLDTDHARADEPVGKARPLKTKSKPVTDLGGGELPAPG